MLTSRRLPVIALCCAIAQLGVVGPALALPGCEPLAASSPDLMQQVARKGTRNNTSETDTPQSDTTADRPDPAKALEDCVAIWDAGTHISKGKWREICKRQLKERGAQLTFH